MERVVQVTINKLEAQLSARDTEIQDLAAQMSRNEGEAERASRDQAGMAFTVRLDQLQPRLLDEDAKREQQAG